MNLIQLCIEKRVAVLVGVTFILLFGWIGLQRMPYQLSPTVIEPEITVTTTWPGATPYEVERDIIEEQEKVLKGIPGLLDMESASSNSQGTVTLKFAIGTDLNSALLRVSNKLDEVPSYPENVDKPIITATGAATSPVVWMVLKTAEGNPASAYTYRTFFENNIRQFLERTPGVAELFIGGGTEKELHIEVSAERLAAHGLTIPRLIDILRSENVDISAGTMGVGRRDYRIRTTSEFRSKEEIEDLIIASTGQRRLRLGEIAQVREGYQKLEAATLHMGREGIAIGVKPEPDANILELTDRLEAVVRQLNEERLKPEKIYIDWTYDQRPYIRGAIDLAWQADCDVLYTGDGKGKTTAALGAAMRAAGHGLTVEIFQFMKGKIEYGELESARMLSPNVVIHQVGRETFVDRKNPDPEDVRLARHGWEVAK